MTFSPLARGVGTWAGDLFTQQDAEKVFSPTLPLLVGEDVHRHGVTVTSRSKSASSTRTCRSACTACSEKPHGEMSLPKTYITRKGPLVLFTAPDDLQELTEKERLYLSKAQKLLKTRYAEYSNKLGSLSRMAESVLTLNDEDYKGNEASISDKDNKIFLKFLHSLETEEDIDLYAQPGADVSFYLQNFNQLQSRNSPGSAISRMLSAARRPTPDPASQSATSVRGSAELLSPDPNRLFGHPSSQASSLRSNSRVGSSSGRGRKPQSAHQLRASAKSARSRSATLPPSHVLECDSPPYDMSRPPTPSGRPSTASAATRPGSSTKLRTRPSSTTSLSKFGKEKRAGLAGEGDRLTHSDPVAEEPYENSDRGVHIPRVTQAWGTESSEGSTSTAPAPVPVLALHIEPKRDAIGADGDARRYSLVDEQEEDPSLDVDGAVLGEADLESEILVDGSGQQHQHDQATDQHSTSPQPEASYDLDITRPEQQLLIDGDVPEADDIRYEDEDYIKEPLMPVEGHHGYGEPGDVPSEDAAREAAAAAAAVAEAGDDAGDVVVLDAESETPTQFERSAHTPQQTEEDFLGDDMTPAPPASVRSRPSSMTSSHSGVPSAAALTHGDRRGSAKSLQSSHQEVDSHGAAEADSRPDGDTLSSRATKGLEEQPVTSGTKPGETGDVDQSATEAAGYGNADTSMGEGDGQSAVQKETEKSKEILDHDMESTKQAIASPPTPPPPPKSTTPPPTSDNTSDSSSKPPPSSPPSSPKKESSMAAKHTSPTPSSPAKEDKPKKDAKPTSTPKKEYVKPLNITSKQAPPSPPKEKRKPVVRAASPAKPKVKKKKVPTATLR